jgi:hypothetical protein
MIQGKVPQVPRPCLSGANQGFPQFSHIPVLFGDPLTDE